MWHSIVHHSFALPCMRVLARKQVISTNGQRQEALSPLPQTSIIFYLLRNTNPEGGHGPTCRLKKVRISRQYLPFRDISKATDYAGKK
jgi:hypothetical protein